MVTVLCNTFFSNMASSLNLTEKVVKIPDNPPEVYSLVNEWITTLMTTSYDCARETDAKLKKWFKAVQALRILQGMMSRGSEGRMYFHGIDCKQRTTYHILVDDVRCVLRCSWDESTMTVHYVKLTTLKFRSQSGESSSSFSPPTPKFTIPDLKRGQAVVQALRDGCSIQELVSELMLDYEDDPTFKLILVDEIKLSYNFMYVHSNLIDRMMNYSFPFLVDRDLLDVVEMIRCDVASDSAVSQGEVLFSNNPFFDLVDEEVMSDELLMKAQIGFNFNVVHTLPPGVTEQLSSFVSNFAGELKDQILALLSNVMICALNLTKPATLLLALVNIAITLGIKNHVMSAMQLFLNPYLEGVAGMRAQSGVDLNTIVPPVAVIGTLFTAYVCEKVPCKDDIDKLCRKLSNIGRGLQGGEKLYTFIASNFTTIIDECYYHFCGIPRGALELKNYLNDVESWMTTVQSLTGLEMADQIVRDVEICTKIDEAYKRGMEYSAMLTQLKGVSGNVIAAFHGHFRVIQRLYDQVLNLGRRIYTRRPRPFVIHLVGLPGVGKSMLVPLLVQNLMVAEGMREGGEEPENHIYYRRVEQEYWCSYKNQFCTLYDDFGQQKDQLSKPNLEFMELINVANVARYPLNMAELLEKNRTEFRSKVVILTSNESCPYVVSLTTPEAVQRRRDVVLDLKLRPGAYDKAAGTVKESEGVQTDIYDIRFVNKYDGKVESEPFSFDAIVKEICRRYRVAKAFQSKKNAWMRDRWTQLVSDNPTEEDFQDCAEQLIADDRAIGGNGLVPTDQSPIDGKNDHPDTVPSDCDGASLGENVLTGSVAADNSTIPCVFKAQSNGIVARSYVPIDDPEEIHGWDALVEFHSWLRSSCPFPAYSPNITESMLPDLILEAQQNPINSFSGYVLGICGVMPDDFTFQISSHGVTPRSTLAILRQAALHVRKSLEETFNKFFKSDVGKRLTSWAKICSCLVAMYGGIKLGTYLGNKLGEYFWPSLRMDSEAASNDSRTVMVKRLRVEARSADARTVQPRRVRAEKGVRKDVVDLMHAQGCLDSGQSELIKNAVYRNMYRVTSQTGSGERHLCNGLIIKGRIMLIPNHALNPMLSGDSFSLRNSTNLSGFVFRNDNFDELRTVLIENSLGESKDALLVELPRSFPSHKNILKHFVLRKELSNYRNFKATLAGLKLNGKQMMYTLYSQLNCNEVGGTRYTDDVDGVTHELYVRKTYEYHVDTEQGDCGAPLVVANTQLQRKLVGMHIAGQPGLGSSTSLSYDDLAEHLVVFGMESQVDLELDLPSLDCDLPNGDFIPLGKVERNYAPLMKTALRPSLLQGYLEPVTTRPSCLAPITVDGVKIDPLTVGLEKCGKPPPDLVEQDLRECVNHYSTKLLVNIDPRHCRVLTYKESIAGADAPYIDPINRRSSPGYPWVNKKDPGMPGKTTWLGEDKYVYDTEDLCDAVRNRIENARRGKRTPVFWIDTLKDERRPIEKVLQGKTRVFSAGAMDYILVYRMFFLGFNAHIMTNRIRNEVAVGINPHSDEWHRLAQHLQCVGDKVTAGDFSSFDGSLSAQMLWYFVDVANAFYDPQEDIEVLGMVLTPAEQNLIRNVLFQDIVSSIHIYRDNCYQWTHSQTSGGPSTVILNSFVNSISVRLVWLDIMRNTEYYDLRHFDEHIRFISYGDDNVMNLSDKILPFFNMHEIVKAYAKIGLTYTMEDKDAKLVAYRKLSEVDFLKRSFTYDRTRHKYHGCLAMSTIMEMMNWVRSDINHELSTKENVETAFDELCLYPERVYEDRKNQVFKAIRSSGLVALPYVPSWKMARIRLEDENRGLGAT